MPNHPPETIDSVLALKLAGYKFRDIGNELQMSKEAARGIWLRHKDKHPLVVQAEPGCAIEGITASEYHLIDDDEVYRRHLLASERRQALERRKRQQVIKFTHGPAALVFVADYHFGNPACNVRRAFTDAELIATIPGCRVVVLGDVFSNMVIGRLAKSLIRQSASIPEETALGRRLLRILGPTVGAVIEGNHEFWSTLLVGHSFFQPVVNDIAPGCIYAQHEAYIDVQVGDWRVPGKVRHKWKGTSIYNPAHGIDRAVRNEQDFLWAAGAHDHGPGVTRDFSVGPLNGIAAKVGTYLYNGEYRQIEGFHEPSKCNIAVGIVFDEDTRSMTGYSSIAALRDYMVRMYR